MGRSIRCRFGGGRAGAVRRPPGGGRGGQQAGRRRVGERAGGRAGSALRQRRGHALDRVGDAQLPRLRTQSRVAPGRGRGHANSVGPAADRVPDGARRPHLPGAGLGGRLRGLLANAVDHHRAGLGPEPGVDDLAGRRRLADAECGVPSVDLGRLTHHPSLSVDPLGSGNAKRLSFLERASALSPSSLETVRRIAESVIIAVISSAALYLVGSVYVDAYYGRLAIEVTSLDLPPPYVALQSVHALSGLLDYPPLLLLVSVLYRILASPSRRLGQWVVRARERFPRLLPVVANLIVVTPLLLDAAASLRERELPHRSVLTEINSVLGYVGLVLLVYVLWLGWDQRRFLLSEVRARKPVPIALVFIAYLLSALVTTGVVAPSWRPSICSPVPHRQACGSPS